MTAPTDLISLAFVVKGFTDDANVYRDAVRSYGGGQFAVMAAVVAAAGVLEAASKGFDLETGDCVYAYDICLPYGAWLATAMAGNDLKNVGSSYGSELCLGKANALLADKYAPLATRLQDNKEKYLAKHWPASSTPKSQIDYDTKAVGMTTAPRPPVRVAGMQGDPPCYYLLDADDNAVASRCLLGDVAFTAATSKRCAAVAAALNGSLQGLLFDAQGNLTGVVTHIEDSHLE